MNGIFCIMMLLGLLYAEATGRADAAQRALLYGGGEAVALLLNLAGAYAFFGGLLGVLRACGAADALARAMEKPLSRLFRFAPGEEEALRDISLNLSAKSLGLGGAATPAGISAMKAMARANPDGRASNAMILFLVVNTSSVQLLPPTMIALRAQAGAANPADIVLPTLLATAASTVCGVGICRLLAGLLALTNFYDAFVRCAEGGLATLIQIAPCLCAILSATALWRETGLLTALTDGLKPVFAALRLPGEAASVVLLRPLSGSAALAAVNDVIRQCGVDSRAARLACVISGASETVFFTASLYLGAADVKRARHAVPAALLAYAAGVLAAARLV